MKQLYITTLLVLLAAASKEAGAELTDGLVAYWPLNGSAADASGNGNHGTIHGGVTFAPDRNGVPSAAAQFDGVNGYIDIGAGVKPPFPLTVAMWVKPCETGHALFRNDQIDDTSYRYGVNFRRGADGRISAYYFEGFSASWNRVGYYSVDPVAVAGEWHHLCVVYQAHRNVHMYWDGQEIAGAYDDGTGSGMSYSGAAGALGHYRTSGPQVVYLCGLLDEVRVYSRALSPAEIQELYNDQSYGACCDPDGSCRSTASGGCGEPGVWHGDWTSCTPNPCPPQVPTQGATWGQIKNRYR